MADRNSDKRHNGLILAFFTVVYGAMWGESCLDRAQVAQCVTSSFASKYIEVKEEHQEHRRTL